jgi:hypothetical protein
VQVINKVAQRNQKSVIYITEPGESQRNQE